MMIPLPETGNKITGSELWEDIMIEQTTHYNIMKQAIKFMRTGDHFLVVSHVQPDGDAISSTLAIGWLLQQWKKSFVMVNEHGVPSKLQYLPLSGCIHSATSFETNVSQQFEMVICVDCADYTRIGQITHWIASNARMVNIDHHSSNNHYGEIAAIQENAAATVEIIFELLNIGEVQFDQEIATILYTGLLTDTGGFRYHNTTARTLKIAAELLQYGINGPQIADRLLEHMSFARIQLLKSSLARLTFSEDKKIGWLFITLADMQVTGAKDEDLEGLVNYACNVEGIEVGLLFKQITDMTVKVSMRSKGEINVAMLAQQFNGGGHIRAAGCQVTGELDEVMMIVIQRVKQAL